MKIIEKRRLKSLDSKRKLISEIISKINNNNFSKLDFDKISSNDNIPIQTISLKNISYFFNQNISY